MKKPEGVLFVLNILLTETTLGFLIPNTLGWSFCWSPVRPTLYLCTSYTPPLNLPGTLNALVLCRLSKLSRSFTFLIKTITSLIPPEARTHGDCNIVGESPTIPHPSGCFLPTFVEDDDVFFFSFLPIFLCPTWTLCSDSNLLSLCNFRGGCEYCKSQVSSTSNRRRRRCATSLSLQSLYVKYLLNKDTDKVQNLRFGSLVSEDLGVD